MTVERRPGPQGASFSSSVAIAADAGTWVYVSGVLAPGGTLADQTRACFRQIGDAVAAHGGALRSVVRITTYLTGLDEYADFAAVRADCFEGALPASTAVQVAGLLQGALVEIDAVAFVEASS